MENVVKHELNDGFDFFHSLYSIPCFSLLPLIWGFFPGQWCNLLKTKFRQIFKKGVLKREEKGMEETRVKNGIKVKEWLIMTSFKMD